jgi:hypothetical protein
LTSRLLLEAGLGNTYYQWGVRELDPNPGRNLVRITDNATIINPNGAVGAMTYRSQNWLVNKTDGANWFLSSSYITGSHSMKFGYQGNWWKDDRAEYTNDQSLAYTFTGGTKAADGTFIPSRPASITEYANPYFNNARAAMMSFFAQDQWTLGRLTLQGAVRYDHPWSWFPEVDQPKSRFFPGVHFDRGEGVTGYNDITPRMGAAYDVFGNGKTALKVNLGKYLQGASVGNLLSQANPSLRIPGGAAAGFANPSVNRTWADNDNDFSPDCDLANPLAQSPATTGSIDTCGQITNLLFGSNQFVGATIDPSLTHGWNVRPSDWSFGASIQQQILPRASVEIGYYRRVFTMFTTGGVVTDNLNVGPNDLTAYTLTAPSDARLPNGGGQQIATIYNLTPAGFAAVPNLLLRSTKDIGDDRRVFDGVDVTFMVRNLKGVTVSGGTSTGKVENDWCDIRAEVPENGNFATNPYCHVSSPFQTSFNGQASYIIPKFDVLLSTVYRDRVILNGTPNNRQHRPARWLAAGDVHLHRDGCDRAGDCLTDRPPPDRWAVQRERGRSGHLLSGPQSSARPELQEDRALRWAAVHRRPGHLQRDEPEHGPLLQHDPGSKRRRVPERERLHEPAGLPPRGRVQLVATRLAARNPVDSGPRLRKSSANLDLAAVGAYY